MDNRNELSIPEKRKELVLAKYERAIDFILRVDPNLCREKYGDMVLPEHCIRSQAITFSELAEWYSKDCPADYIAVHLATLNIFVNVSQHLTKEQIKEIAFWIVKRWPYLNIAELTLVISRIKMGGYGPLYNNLSGEFILNCFSEYVKERRAAIYKENAEMQKPFPNIQSLGAALIQNMDKMPNLKKMVEDTRKQKEAAAAQELDEKKQRILRLKDIL